jgi:hypothetical protein
MPGFLKTALQGLAGALGPGLFSLGSDMITNRGALRRQQLADQENERRWHMQNAYNTPKEQMARLKEGGLNPNLIYGSGGANTGVAGAMAPSKAAPYNVRNPVPLQAALIGSQIENLNSVTEKNKAETARTLGMTPYQIDNSLSKAEQTRQTAAQELIKTSILSTTKKDQIEKIVQDTLLTKAKKTETQSKAEFTKKMLDMNINPNSGMGSQLIQFIFGTTDDALKYLGDNKNYPSFGKTTN